MDALLQDILTSLLTLQKFNFSFEVIDHFQSSSGLASTYDYLFPKIKNIWKDTNNSNEDMITAVEDLICRPTQRFLLHQVEKELN